MFRLDISEQKYLLNYILESNNDFCAKAFVTVHFKYAIVSNNLSPLAHVNPGAHTRLAAPPPVPPPPLIRCYVGIHSDTS